MNGDGRDDLLVTSLGNDGARAFLSTGSAFAGATAWTSAAGGVDGFVIGNFDGAAGDDLLWAGNGTQVVL